MVKHHLCFLPSTATYDKRNRRNIRKGPLQNQNPWNEIWYAWLGPGSLPPEQIWWRSKQRGLLGKYVKLRCLWLSLFFPNRPGDHISQPIFTQNGLNDVFPRIDVPFAVKSKLFLTPDHQAPKTAKIWQFWAGQNVRSISPLILAVS